MKEKIKKSFEVSIEEAIHRNKAKIAKRKKLCMIDDCEIFEAQQYVPEFKGTHPIGEDANEKRRKEWLKDYQRPDPYKRIYQSMIWVAVGYFGMYVFVALLRLLFKI